MSEFGPSPRLALTQKELKIGIGWARDVIRRLDLILDPECVNKWIASRSSSKLQSRVEWAPEGGQDQAAVLTVCRACCSSNCTGLR
jgi:hypothetical protein